MTKIEALIKGRYILLQHYHPTSKAVQASTKEYSDVTGADVMPSIHTLIRGMGIHAPLDTVYFVTPEGLDSEFSEFAAPIFLIDSWSKAAEDLEPETEAVKQNIVLRAADAFNAYAQDLISYLNEHGHLPAGTSPCSEQK